MKADIDEYNKWMLEIYGSDFCKQVAPHYQNICPNNLVSLLVRSGTSHKLPFIVENMQPTLKYSRHLAYQMPRF